VFGGVESCPFFPAAIERNLATTHLDGLSSLPNHFLFRIDAVLLNPKFTPSNTASVESLPFLYFLSSVFLCDEET
jgi:hypothetical protein